MELKQIYDVKNLKLRFKNKKALEIKTLKFHNGLIYGICGNFGSGKTSLLKVLSGEIKESMAAGCTCPLGGLPALNALKRPSPS